VAQRRGSRELLIGHGPLGGGAVVCLLAVQDFQRVARLRAPQRLVQHLLEGSIDAEEALPDLPVLHEGGIGGGGGEGGVEAQEGPVADLKIGFRAQEGDAF
jgi:hypothetical protein